MTNTAKDETWSIAEASARLSELLRLAEVEGPQRIGDRETFLVVPERLWKENFVSRKPMGQWLVENFPRGLELELPPRDDPDRPIPFLLEEDE